MTMSIFRLSNLSAIAPPTSPRVMSGMARNRFTSPIEVAEPVNCHVSQLRAICSAHMAVACPSCPSQSRRKLRSSSEAKGTRSLRQI